MHFVLARTDGEKTKEPCYLPQAGIESGEKWILLFSLYQLFHLSLPSYLSPSLLLLLEETEGTLQGTNKGNNLEAEFIGENTALQARVLFSPLVSVAQAKCWM